MDFHQLPAASCQFSGNGTECTAATLASCDSFTLLKPENGYDGGTGVTGDGLGWHNCRSRWNMVDPTLTLESLPNLPTSIQHDSTFSGVPSLCLNKAWISLKTLQFGFLQLDSWAFPVVSCDISWSSTVSAAKDLELLMEAKWTCSVEPKQPWQSFLFWNWQLCWWCCCCWWWWWRWRWRLDAPMARWQWRCQVQVLTTPSGWRCDKRGRLAKKWSLSRQETPNSV